MSDLTAGVSVNARAPEGAHRSHLAPPIASPQPARPMVLEMLASVLADLTYPAQPWQIVVTAESYGADARTVTRLYRLPAATYLSLGHIAHAYIKAGDPAVGRRPRL